MSSAAVGPIAAVRDRRLSGSLIGVTSVDVDEVLSVLGQAAANLVMS
jgi:hypothetical protein